MASYTKHEIFVEDLAEGIHDLDTNQLRIALSSTAPTVVMNVLADVTGEIAYTNITEDRNITLTTSDSSTSTYKIVLADVVLTATGAVQTFRYVVVYNDGTLGKVNPLIAFYDHGSNVTLANGETFTIDFDDANGFFQITQT